MRQQLSSCRPVARSRGKGVDEPVAHHRVVGERVRASAGARVRWWAATASWRALEESWARARAGTLPTPGVVFRGEPGIGKSRLAAAAAELVEALRVVGAGVDRVAVSHRRRACIRCGRCWNVVAESTACTDQAERLRLLNAEVRPHGLDPGSVVPLLAPVLGIGAEAGYEPVPAEGRKLYELIAQAVQDYLLACLGDVRGLVVAEDVHWFDPSTLEVLGALLDRRPVARLLVVITGRPGEWLPANWPVEVFDLTPLTDEQTDALISALDPAPDERPSGGGRRALRRGAVLHRAGRGRHSPRPGCPRRCMSRCSPGCARAPKVVPVVEAAAVIGRHVDRGLLCSVVDLSDDEVDDVIDELEDALVLEPWGPDGWRFRHELLREVAAELAPPSVRPRAARQGGRRTGQVRTASRTGGWSPPTTSGPSGSTRRPRPTSRRRQLRRLAAPWPRPATYLTRALTATRPRRTRPGSRSRAKSPCAWSADSSPAQRRRLPKPRRRSRFRAVPAAGRDRSAMTTNWSRHWLAAAWLLLHAG